MSQASSFPYANPLGRSGLFDIPDDVTYLNAAFVTPIPRIVGEAGMGGVARKAQPWLLSRSSFYDVVAEARAAAARLIGARAADIAIVGSTSYGIATAAANLALGAGQVVLTMEDEHPSPVYMWIRTAAAAGAVHEEVSRPADDDWTGAILARLGDRQAPRVAVLSLTAVHWNDGSRLDLASIRAAADESGTALVVDGTQSIGAQPFSVAEIRPDFLVFATYKWTLGPYGLAFLYADPARQGGVPLEEHAFSRQGADSLSNHYGRELAFAAGAQRYDMGERSNFVTLPMAIAGMTLLHEIGIEAVAAYLRPLTDRIHQGAAGLGLSAPDPARRSAHLIGLRRDGWDAGAAAAELVRQGIHVSARNGALRVAPHIYNDLADIERFLSALSRLV